MFLDTKMRTVLHNCLFMPSLGINLISQSCLSENIHTILTSNTISIYNKTQLKTKGNKPHKLYDLPIQVNKEISQNEDIQVFKLVML